MARRDTTSVRYTPSTQQRTEAMFFILNSLSSAQKKKPATGITINPILSAQYSVISCVRFATMPNSINTIKNGEAALAFPSAEI